MNNFFYLLLILSLFSCKSSSVAQEQPLEKSPKNKIERPAFGDPNDNEITKLPLNPKLSSKPSLEFIGSVKQLEEKKQICHQKYNLVSLLHLKKIKGAAKNKLPKVGSTIDLGFANEKLIKEFTSLKKAINSNNKTQLSFKVKEIKCIDKETVIYEVMSFTPVK